MRLHTTIAASALLLLAACGADEGETGNASASTTSTSGTAAQPNELTGTGASTEHEHEAQHGGLLVSLARNADFAWAEVLFDPEVGAIDLYLYGAHAETPARSKQASIGLEVRTSEASMVLQLQAVADALTGETVGDTSHFLVEDDRLRGIEEFDGKIKRVQVLGQIFDEPRFSWPIDRFADEPASGERTDLGSEGARDGD